MDNRRNKTLLRPGLKKNKSGLIKNKSSEYSGYFQGFMPSADHAKGGVSENRQPQAMFGDHAAAAAPTTTAEHTPIATSIKTFCGYCGHEWFADTTYCVFCGKHSFNNQSFGHGGTGVSYGWWFTHWLTYGWWITHWLTYDWWITHWFTHDWWITHGW